jgi:hypothetical protein
MNELAGVDHITLANIPIDEQESEHIINDREIRSHVPPAIAQLGMTVDEEAMEHDDPESPTYVMAWMKMTVIASPGRMVTASPER